MGRAPGYGGVVTIVLITGSHVDITVYRLNVPLDFISLVVRDCHQLAERVYMSLVACTVAAQSALEQAITIIWKGTPSTNAVGTVTTYTTWSPCGCIVTVISTGMPLAFAVVHELSHRYPHRPRSTMVGSL
jgi:hypothetical protein